MENDKKDSGVQQVDVRLSGAIEFQQKTDLATAVSILNLLTLGTGTRANGGVISAPVVGQSVNGLSADSAWEAIKKTGAVTNPQKIATIVGFLSKERGLGSEINIQDLKEAFADVGETLPKNITRDVRLAMRFGWLKSSPGGFVLTSRGREQLAIGFNGVDEPQASPKKRSRQHPGVSMVTPGILEKLDVSTSPKGFPNYHSVSRKTDRIIWLLAYADKKGHREGLTSSDISALARELRDGIRSNTIVPLTATSLKNGLIEVKGGRYSVLEKGIRHISSMSEENH